MGFDGPIFHVLRIRRRVDYRSCDPQRKIGDGACDSVAKVMIKPITGLRYSAWGCTANRLFFNSLSRMVGEMEEILTF